ncbi:MAG: LPXTG cell wall anchor domain-containing protein [Clostridia bacterium]|nr:LPXTG cell wall anchor domain-containing protein [Clostridia bacterium]
MQTAIKKYTKHVKFNKDVVYSRAVALIFISAVVIAGVFWWLKIIGITMAGEAFCGYDEHQHDAACLVRELVCETAHDHSEDCYQTSCLLGKEEHIHTVSCYSDITADLETASVWEKTFKDVELTGNYAEDIVLIAKSQLGYNESERNYQVDDNANRFGYTRYGEWYGNPYGEWSAMFVGFCLEYAEVPAEYAPISSGSETMRLEWATLENYVDAEGYSPIKGDVLFLDKNSDNAADSVAVIYSVGSEKIVVIEGDYNNAVEKATYDLSDSSIMGYGSMRAVIKNLLTEDDYATLDYFNGFIADIPSPELVEYTLLNYENKNDMDGYIAYKSDIAKDVSAVYNFYNDDLKPILKPFIEEYDKILELSWVWQADKQGTVAASATVSVMELNDRGYYQDPSPFATQNKIYTGGSISQNSNSTIASTPFYWWACYVIQKDADSGKYYVQKIITDTADDKRSYSPADADLDGDIDYNDGFIFLVHWREYKAAGGQEQYIKLFQSVTWDTAMGNCFTANWGADWTNHNAIGTLYFGVNAQLKPTVNNNSALSTIQGAYTRDIVEINLYDYNYNINNWYKSDNKYPGFQRPSSATATGMVNSTTGLMTSGAFNFGDTVVTNFGSTTTSVGKTDVDTINKIVNLANSPNRGYMYPTLVGGYPALKDGTSLSYLFTENSAVDKLNTQSITGLFQYDEVGQEYYFNCRDNHAQYNASNDTFTLYQQTITPNFMMYPFGNFLPLNDIRTQCTKLNYCNYDYFERISASSMFRYNQGRNGGWPAGAAPYLQLSQAIDKFQELMIAEEYGIYNDTGRAYWWDYLAAYFQKADIPVGNVTQTPGLYDKNGVFNLYNIDFDEATNFFFGMDMHFEFIQPYQGLVGQNNDHMIFYFTGDDDVWVYVDGILFLDLTGIHRHVGGSIDFTTGVVNYYEFDKNIGDVNTTTPIATQTFAEILGSSASLNASGTFADYSEHTFDFYYMERGSGSGVCNMNFNISILEKNTISVTKETMASDGNVEALGNPWYYFQVCQNGSDASYLTPYYEFSVLNSAQELLRTDKVDANGIFRIKAGETAVFSNISEDAGVHYVRELVDPAVVSQYAGVMVDGVVSRYFYDTTVAGKAYKFFSSAPKNISNGSTTFSFTNMIDTSQYGVLNVTKDLRSFSQSGGPGAATWLPFDIYVEVDGTPLPVGYSYQVVYSDGVTETRTVETAGIVKVYSQPPNRPGGTSGTGTAIIPDILGGSEVKVYETADSSDGYTVTYSGTNISLVKDASGAVSGVVPGDATAEIAVINEEGGATLDIPFKKTMLHSDGTERTYTFELIEVTSLTDMTPVVGGKYLTTTVTLSEGSVESLFSLIFTSSTTTNGVHYYMIREVGATATNGMDTDVYVFDLSIYVDRGRVSLATPSFYKNGSWIAGGDTYDPTNAYVQFENSDIRSITITKYLENLDVGNAKFDFTLSLSLDGSPLNGTYPVSGIDGITEATFVNGLFEFQLGADESITISSLPYDTAWEVTEAKVDGVTAKSGTNEIPLRVGSTINGELHFNESVIFVNMPTGVELPSTGSYGNQIFIYAGLLIIALSLVCGCIIRRRR